IRESSRVLETTYTSCTTGLSTLMATVLTDAQKAGEHVGLSPDDILITGGNPLRVRIGVRGAKNLATKAMVAALLGETPSVLRDVPEISDVDVVRGLLE